MKTDFKEKTIGRFSFSLSNDTKGDCYLTISDEQNGFSLRLRDNNPVVFKYLDLLSDSSNDNRIENYLDSLERCNQDLGDEAYCTLIGVTSDLFRVHEQLKGGKFADLIKPLISDMISTLNHSVENHIKLIKEIKDMIDREHTLN